MANRRCDCCRSDVNLEFCIKNRSCDCNDCRSELNVDKLCAKEIKACKIIVEELEIEGELCAKLSSPEICAQLVMAKKADVNSICSTDLNSMNACLQNANINNLSASNVIASNLCVPGQLKAANFINCGKYRASVAFSAPQTYVLGGDLAFNFILDDPNNNISFLPTTYNVPVSGYYILTLKVNASNLQSSSGPILGQPVGNPEIYVNGVQVREQFLPWLTFNNASKILLTSLISLDASDKVTMKYKVLALDASAGLIEIAGTVDIFGNSMEDGNSLFKISLLNADCAPGQPGQADCAPNIPCAPCTPQQCVPCVPGNSVECHAKDMDGSSSGRPMVRDMR